MGNWPGAIVRADSISDRFYLGLLSGSNDYSIYRRWNGGYDLLAHGTTVNHQVGVDVENSHNYAFWSANSFSQDQYSQVRISNVGPWNGAIVRAQLIIDRFYLAFVFGVNDYRIYLRKDGLYYSLSSGNTETWAAGDIIGLEATGLNPVQLTLLRNGNPVLTYTDTTENLFGGSPGTGSIHRPAIIWQLTSGRAGIWGLWGC